MNGMREHVRGFRLNQLFFTRTMKIAESRVVIHSSGEKIFARNKREEDQPILTFPQMFPFSMTWIRRTRAMIKKSFPLKNYYFMSEVYIHIVYIYISFFFLNAFLIIPRFARIRACGKSADGSRGRRSVNGRFRESWVTFSGCTRDRTFMFAAII